MKTFFGALVTAMITPFDKGGQLNLPEAIKIGAYLIENGSDTILLAGTTGESPTLSHSEEYELFEVVSKSLKGQVKVMAGAGSNCTRTAVEVSQKAEERGVDSLLQVVPYYNKPCQEGLFDHFRVIAENTSLPIMLYNIPGRTSRNLEPETVARLSQIKNIVAIKEAAGDVDQAQKIRDLTGPDFLIYSGDDPLTLEMMKRGAVGVVSVASHCVGAQIKEMVTLFAKGQQEQAYEIQEQLMPIYDALFMTTNPAPVKMAMKLMGFDVGSPRLPILPLTEKETEQLQEALVKGGVPIQTRPVIQ